MLKFLFLATMTISSAVYAGSPTNCYSQVLKETVERMNTHYSRKSLIADTNISGISGLGNWTNGPKIENPKFKEEGPYSTYNITTALTYRDASKSFLVGGHPTVQVRFDPTNCKVLKLISLDPDEDQEQKAGTTYPAKGEKALQIYTEQEAREAIEHGNLFACAGAQKAASSKPAQKVQ